MTFPHVQRVAAPAQQLELPLWHEEALCHELESQTQLTIRLVITDNASTVMSVRHHGRGRASVRLHHMFLSAGPRVMRALAHWVGRPGASVAAPALNDFIRQNEHRIRRAKPRVAKFQTLGIHHDLKKLFDEVNDAEFDNTVDAGITWGKRPARRRRCSIRFGSYSLTENLVRIHPYLDQDFVPEFFVKYIVFHEMLHAHLGFEQSPDGRNLMHTPEFNKREAAYPEYARAVAWQDNHKNLRRLLR